MAETQIKSEEKSDGEPPLNQKPDNPDPPDKRSNIPPAVKVKPPALWIFWAAVILAVLCTVSAWMYASWPGVTRENDGSSARTIDSAGIRPNAPAIDKSNEGASASKPALLRETSPASESVPNIAGSKETRTNLNSKATVERVARSFSDALFASKHGDTVFQSVYVAFLTVLAFLAHSLDSSKANSIGRCAETSDMSKLFVELRRMRFFLALFFIPTLIFFVAMILHGREDAAVYLMAIVAIYVAAQHYVALRQQEEVVGNIEGHTVKLNEIRETLSVQVEALTVQVGSIRSALTEQVDDLKNQVKSIRNALGTEYSQLVLYEKYRIPSDRGRRSGSDFTNTGIYAVYRILDIDKQWMREEQDECWGAYCDVARKETLYASLYLGCRTRVLIVTDMKTRVDRTDNTRSGIVARTLHFEKFVGLMWHTVVLRKAARALALKGIFADYEIKIGESSNWMHVVDHTVYQMFGSIPTNIYSRNLTEDTARVNDSFAGENLVKWAMEDIQRVAMRGADSVDYLCAAISEAKMFPYFSFSQGTFQDILESLDFDLWFNNRSSAYKEFNDKKTAMARLCYLMKSFLECIDESFPPTGQDFDARHIYKKIV